MNSTTMTDTLIAITLDDASIVRRAPNVEDERRTAIADLLAGNVFSPQCIDAGPYEVFLSVRDNRLLFRISSERLEEPREVILPITPFRGIIRDYFMMCESYFAALGQTEPHRLEALDMGRRGVHNEGSELLIQQLQGRIKLDFDTARRLFTLICVLHIK